MNDFIKNAIESALALQQQINEASGVDPLFNTRKNANSAKGVPSGKSALKNVCERNKMSLVKIVKDRKTRIGFFDIYIEFSAFGGGKIKFTVPSQIAYDYDRKSFADNVLVKVNVPFYHSQTNKITVEYIDNLIKEYQYLQNSILDVYKFVQNTQPDAYEGNSETPLVPENYKSTADKAREIDKKVDNMIKGALDPEFDLSGPSEEVINAAKITSHLADNNFVITVPVRKDTEKLIDNFEKSVIGDADFKVSTYQEPNKDSVQVKHIKVSDNADLTMSQRDNVELTKSLYNKALEYFGVATKKTPKETPIDISNIPNSESGLKKLGSHKCTTTCGTDIFASEREDMEDAIAYAVNKNGEYVSKKQFKKFGNDGLKVNITLKGPANKCLAIIKDISVQSDFDLSISKITV